MATYQSKFCPHCFNPYQLHQLKGTEYGCPFITCSKCNKTFFDKDVKEMALECNRPIVPNRFSFLDFVFLPASVVAFCAAKESPEMATLFFIFGVVSIVSSFYLIVSAIKEYPEIVKEFNKEYYESVARLSNIEYAKALKGMGVYVPDRFLFPKTETNMQATTDNQEKTVLNKVKVKPIKKTIIIFNLPTTC